MDADNAASLENLIIMEMGSLAAVKIREMCLMPVLLRHAMLMHSIPEPKSGSVFLVFRRAKPR